MFRKLINSAIRKIQELTIVMYLNFKKIPVDSLEILRKKDPSNYSVSDESSADDFGFPCCKEFCVK